jgi:hypothetical protein
MLKNENITSDYFSNKNNIIFSFGKSDKINENSKNKMNENLVNNENKNNNKGINDRETCDSKFLKCISIYKLLNKNNIQTKENLFPLFNLNNINQSNNTTKPKIELNKDENISPKKNLDRVKYYKLLDNKQRKVSNCPFKSEQLFDNNVQNNIKSITKREMMKIFEIKSDSILPYEIEYLLDNPSFLYDFEHQNDNNSNYQYVNENFIDILLKSFNNKMILDYNIKYMKEIQTEITFPKRNILVSWLTEINYKYIKNQNILFTAIKFLDRILYKKNININEFQLLGILCFNLALKMENHHKVFYIDEIISLIGGLKEKDIHNKSDLIKKIKLMEKKICDFLNFDLVEVTSVSILRRLIQMMNIQNKRTEELFISVAFFFLELSLYDEKFYEIDDFSKALSSLIMAKEILKNYFYKFGFHNYLENCARLKKKEIKLYFNLCQETIKNLKIIKYGSTLFIKYQQKDFHNIINNYLNVFILHCIQHERKGV